MNTLTAKQSKQLKKKGGGLDIYQEDCLKCSMPVVSFSLLRTDLRKKRGCGSATVKILDSLMCNKFGTDSHKDLRDSKVSLFIPIFHTTILINR